MAETTKLIAKVQCPHCKNVCKVKHPMKAGIFSVSCSSCGKSFNARFEAPQNNVKKEEDHIPVNEPEQHEVTNFVVSPDRILKRCNLVMLRPFLFFFTKKTPFFLRNGETIIGRKDSKYVSNIAIEGDPYMNRRAVAIHVEPCDGGYLYRMEVLRSTNSVYRNGDLLTNGESVYLRYDDEIMIGHTKFILQKME